MTDEVRAETKAAEQNGGMSRDRLKELRRQLAEEAPDAVKAKMAQGPERDIEVSAAPKPETAPRPIGKLDMPAL